MIGFTFNGKHNFNDFGIYLESKSIQPPSKKKIKPDIPYMNSSYDFSTVGSNGEIIYTERSIKIVLGLPTKSKQQCYILYSKILEWLEDVGQSQLVFDEISDCYFMAEVETMPTFTEVYRFGRLEVVFICEPFKQGINLEGSDIWDDFNFETDIAQDVGFDVVGTKTISLYNSGRSISPTINCNAIMTAIINGYTINLILGYNNDWLFRLQPGVNTIVISGTGHISFQFRKTSL